MPPFSLPTPMTELTSTLCSSFNLTECLQDFCLSLLTDDSLMCVLDTRTGPVSPYRAFPEWEESLHFGMWVPGPQPAQARTQSVVLGDDHDQTVHICSRKNTSLTIGYALVLGILVVLSCPKMPLDTKCELNRE